MIKTKAVLVIGETKTYNGLQVRNLGEKVEKAVDEALKGIGEGEVIDIKVNTQYMGISGDQAFILILYKESKSEERASEKLEIQKEKEVEKIEAQKEKEAENRSETQKVRRFFKCLRPSGKMQKTT